ncbi:MAG: hypothetical protein JWN64_480 [Parcubacteria group bacterium]|nr:hypothetical protein [Parcubacteria group bacterium]
MTYDFKARKIIAIISDSLEPWQAMNVLGHMAIAIGANKDGELMGRSVLKDGSGIKHAGIARFGFVIKKGSSAKIADLIGKARTMEDLLLVDFPREMLDTRHDDKLNDSMAGKQESDFEYLGATLYGATEAIRILTEEFQLYS